LVKKHPRKLAYQLDQNLLMGDPLPLMCVFEVFNAHCLNMADIIAKWLSPPSHLAKI